ncbi:MAG: hypothetical protein E6G44_01885 [Actinobacteria bacterium]|nr:MAG: hypothetical protein E6G44_01885 [Actinomycetota bacterium]
MGCREPMSVKRPESASIPDAPGAYLFRDADARVIYVGKAMSLRKRLASYWGRPLHARTEAMLEQAETVEWIVATTEVDALMLEYNLIKAHRPRFNVRYRDDKSYPYLALTVGERWPRARVLRGPKRKDVRYFGPYGHAYAIRETLDALTRVFPVRTCSNAFFDQRARARRPCLYYDIGRCAGPRAGDHGGDRRGIPGAGRGDGRLPGRQPQTGPGQDRRRDAPGGEGPGVRAGGQASRPARRGPQGHREPGDGAVPPG